MREEWPSLGGQAPAPLPVQNEPTVIPDNLQDEAQHTQEDNGNDTLLTGDIFTLIHTLTSLFLSIDFLILI